LGGLEGVLFRRLAVLRKLFNRGCRVDLQRCESRIRRRSRFNILAGQQIPSCSRTKRRHNTLSDVETIREYALERLRESDEVESVQTGFMQFFLKLSQFAERQLAGPGQGEWLERLEAEVENLRAALAWNVQDPELAIGQLNLALALSRFWLVRGYWAEGLACLLRVSARPAIEAMAGQRSRALNSCGSFACQLGRYEEAAKYYGQSLAIRRELQDERGAAATLNNLGLVHKHQDNHEAAQPLFEEALQLFRILQENRSMAACLTNLAAVQNANGDCGAADQSASEALVLFRAIGDELGIAASLTELGHVAMSRGQIDSAHSHFEQSLQLSRALGEKVGVAESLQSLGELMIAEKKYESARILYEESFDIARDLSSARHMAAAEDALERLTQALTGGEEHAARAHGNAGGTVVRRRSI
jgi:tetratricopeptide (TPR) repeat protein